MYAILYKLFFCDQNISKLECLSLAWLYSFVKYFQIRIQWTKGGGASYPPILDKCVHLLQRQTMWPDWATFTSSLFYIFTQMSTSRTLFVILYNSVSFDVDVLDFSILIFWLQFGPHFLKFGDFFNLLVTLVTKTLTFVQMEENQL